MSTAIRLLLPQGPGRLSHRPCEVQLQGLQPGPSPPSMLPTQCGWHGQPLTPHSGSFQETMTVTAALAFLDKRYIWCDSRLDFRPGSYILSGEHILSN